MGDGAAPPPGHWGFAEPCAVEASAPQQQAVQQQLAIRELAAAMLPCHLDLQEHCTWLDLHHHLGRGRKKATGT